MALLTSPIKVIYTTFLWLTCITHTSCMSINYPTYIVHMDKSSMPKAFSSHDMWYTSMLASTVESDVATDIIYTYDNAIHGFAAKLSPSQLSHLKDNPGILSFHLDMPMKRDTTYTPKFLGLQTDSGLWSVPSQGEDVIIGMVDTGIWPESASFNDNSFGPVPKRWRGTCETGPGFGPSSCNKKLIGARAFNKGLLAQNPNLTLSTTTPRDTDGHGTHTSSTAGGSPVIGASFFGYGLGTANGIAPRARLAMYKALWEEGGYESDVIAAIEQAIIDGVDVLSLSLGLDGVPLYKDPVAIASYSAMERGVIVVASSGNEGPDLGLLHNGIPWLTTVGASTVDRVYACKIQLRDGMLITGESIYLGSPSLLKNLPLVFVDDCTNKTLLKRARGKIILCYPNDNLGRAVLNVKASKVAGSLFITNDIYEELFVRFTFPGAIITPQDGTTILSYINGSSNPTATLEFRQTILGGGTSPKVTTYSSRGPSVSCPLVLKPDIVAPGSLIFASWAQNTTVGSVGSHDLFAPFNIISGTSMACPHVSGVSALLKAVRPDWTPAMIRSAIMTTANLLDNTLNSIKDIGTKNHIATPLAMGSGQIVPNKALDPGLVYDAGPNDYLNLLCGLNFTIDQIKVITKSSSIDCKNASKDLNYPSFIAIFNANNVTSMTKNTVRVFKRVVTNVGDGGATYSARVKGVKGLLIDVRPNKLVFKDKFEKQSFEIRIEGQIKNKKEEVVHGSLIWIDEDGKYEVRSPIVVTTFSSDPF
ncbi:hypothetical protein LUZ60_001697 [Juncus effusus]|nr:hypothetical protein LUZ60_001697 [Juncus effusus]